MNPIRPFAIITALLMVVSSLAGASSIIADHGAAADFALLPDSLFGMVRDSLRIFYGHTSHGSQVITGLNMLAGEDALYARPTFYEISDDLGASGDTSWVQPTRNFLNQHPDYNVVMWSWCGGVSSNTEEGIAIYLNAMNGLEAQYPNVAFVYMTGHLDGSGPEDNLYVRNDQIRDWCAANDKVLFDFADIESWDPDGNYYPWDTDACNWCAVWCAQHDCPDCPSCAHSHCFNCYQKGKAWWWMAARLLGWAPLTAAPGGAARAAVATLSPNRPNPFNPRTEIAFSLGAAGTARLSIHDVAGRTLAVLANGVLDAGEHRVVWDGRDAAGAGAPSGVYFVRLQAGAEILTRKIALVR